VPTGISGSTLAKCRLGKVRDNLVQLININVNTLRNCT